MQLKAAILSAFLAIAPASAHLRNVHDKNNKNGATTIDDEAALRNHITSWIDELKDSTAANNEDRRLATSQHCVDVKDSAANILSSALEGCGTAASGSLPLATNESPNPTCLLLLCEAHFKAAEIVTPECGAEDPDFDRNDILACQLTPGYLPPEPPTANDVELVAITEKVAFAHVLDNVNGTFGFDLELQQEIVTQAANGECAAFSFGPDFGKVKYVSDEGFVGDDSCEYKVCYKEGTRYADVCSTAFVNVTVVAHPTSSPTAAPTLSCDVTLELNEPEIPLVDLTTCEGKLTQLQLKYNGGDCTQSNNGQNGKFECEDSNGGPNTEDAVSITVTDKNGKVLKLGDESLAVDVDVSVGDILTLEPPEDETQFESEINIVVKSPQEEIAPALQELTIHTSCSQGLSLLDKFGSTQVFAYTDTKGNDLTVEQPVTVKGGLNNNNGQNIEGTLFTLNGEDIAFENPIDGDGLSFEETMMTDLSQESLEYTLAFSGGVVNGPSCSVDPLVIEVVNLPPSTSEPTPGSSDRV